MKRLSMLASLLLSACGSLPELIADTCGNGVVEDGEACDLYTPKKLRDTAVRCGAPTLEDGRACRFICEGRDSTQCPSGWACGADGLCRRPDWLGAEQTGEVEIYAESFGLADFDGDDAIDLQGGSADLIQVPYGDGEGGFLAETQLRTARRQGAAAATDLNGDGRDDLVVPLLSGIDIVKGEIERALSPQLQTIRIGDEPLDLRVLLPRIGPSCRGGRPLVLFGSDDAAGDPQIDFSFVGDSASHRTFPFVELPTGLGGIPGPIPVQDLDGDGVDEVLVAPPNANGAGLFRIAEIGSPATCAEARYVVDTVVLIVLGTAKIDGRSAIADVDGDGNVDILFDTDEGPRVALGPAPVAGAWSTVADVRALFDARCARPIGGHDLVPLAVGQLDGDHGADLVTDDAVYIDGGASFQGGQLVGRLCRVGTIADRLSDAVIADFNADEVLDVASIGGGGGLVSISLQVGGAFSSFDFPLSLPVEMLRSGDFDGDGFGDLAFVERDQDAATLRIIYGGPGLGIAEPQEMGELTSIRSVETGYLASGGLVADGRTDLVIGANGDPDGPGVDRIALVAGLGSRRMFAPLLFVTQDRNEELRVQGLYGAEVTPEGPEKDLIGFGLRSESQVVTGQFFAYLPGQGTLDLDSSRLVARPTSTKCTARFALGDRTCVASAAGSLEPNAAASLIVVDGHRRCPTAPDPQICVFDPSAGPDADICKMSSEVNVEGTSVALDGVQTADLADLDLDGDLDLIVAFAGRDGSASGAAIFWREAGSGCGFPRTTALSIPAPRAAVALNADDDPELELAVLTIDSVFIVDDLSTSPHLADEPIISVDGEPLSLVAADLDQDGLSELLIGLAGNVSIYRPAGLSLPRPEVEP